MSKGIKIGKKSYVLRKRFFVNIFVLLLLVSPLLVGMNSDRVVVGETIEVVELNTAVEDVVETLYLTKGQELFNKIVEEVHPEIVSYSSVFLENANKEYWQEVYENTDLDPEYIAGILMAIAQVETGQGYQDDEKPSSNNTGNGWGLLQIEYLGKPIRSSLVKSAEGIDVQIKTTRDSNDERLNPEKSIEWATAHFYNLLTFFDYDIEMAIQGYNYGGFALKWLVDDYGADWVNNLDKVTKSIERKINQRKASHGDSLYLQKVLALASI